MTYVEYFSAQKELYQRIMIPICKAYDITFTELSILLFLANNPQYNTATQIVEIRHLAKSHVSTSLRSLEERGFLRREFRGSDRRTVYIVLLPASAKAIADGQEAQKTFFSFLFKDFTDEEKKTFDEMFHRIINNILESLENPDVH